MNTDKAKEFIEKIRPHVHFIKIMGYGEDHQKMLEVLSEFAESYHQERIKEVMPSDEDKEKAIKEIGKESTAPDYECPLWLEADIAAGINWYENWLKQKIKEA